MDSVRRITVVVGNPKQPSRTSRIATEISTQVTSLLHKEGFAVEVHVIELAEIAPFLFEWGNVRVQEKLMQTATSDLLIVASPTFKATYTGLLKAFVDQLAPNALNGVIAIPVMVGAAPNHELAVEAFLRPLLVELGASCPFRGLYLLDSKMEEVAEQVSHWLEGAAPLLLRTMDIATVER